MGVFDQTLPNVALATGVRDYHGQKLDAEHLGLQLAGHLAQGLHNSGFQQPGYLWFIIEHSGDDQFVYLYLLK